MSTVNTTALMQKGVNTNTVCGQFNECQVVLDNIKGTNVPKTAINRLVLFEDIFTLLPTATIDIQDDGTYYNLGSLSVGQTIYIQYKPTKTFNKEKSKPSYISIRMKVMSLTIDESMSNLCYRYHLVCCYDALGVIGAVVPYPQRSELDAANITSEETSVNAIKAQLNAGGLSVTESIDSDDSMKWINTRHKIQECVSKFLAHSWIAEDDAMLVYTSLVNDNTFNENSDEKQIEEAFNASTKISSCKTLRDKIATATYISIENPKNDTGNIRYSKLVAYGAAGISTLKNAYKQVEYVYTPMGTFDTDLINEMEFTINDEVMDNVAAMKNVYNSGIRRVEYDNPEISLADKSSKIDTLYNYTNNITHCGMHFFEDTHAHYDVAPAHNKAIISSFFNNTVEITFDVNQQVDDVYLSNTLPYIGQKVHLDTQVTEENSPNYTGNYIVAQTKFIVQNDAATICSIVLISDGTYYTQTDNNK